MLQNGKGWNSGELASEGIQNGTKDRLRVGGSHWRVIFDSLLATKNL
jgi:hypothetical protein